MSHWKRLLEKKIERLTKALQSARQEGQSWKERHEALIGKGMGHALDQYSESKGPGVLREHRRKAPKRGSR